MYNFLLLNKYFLYVVCLGVILRPFYVFAKQIVTVFLVSEKYSRFIKKNEVHETFEKSN